MNSFMSVHHVRMSMLRTQNTAIGLYVCATNVVRRCVVVLGVEFMSVGFGGFGRMKLGNL